MEVKQKRRRKLKRSAVIMVGVCQKCGELLVRPHPSDTAVCQCKSNPHPIKVELKPMVRVTLKQIRELEHPEVITI